MPPDEELGQRIKSAREEAGLTQRELANLVGLADGQAVSNYERAVTQPTRERLRRISEATRKPLAYFLDGEEDWPDPVGLLRELLDAVAELHQNQAVQLAALKQNADALARLETLYGSLAAAQERRQTRPG